MRRLLNNYSCYSLKVLIGTIILVITAVVTTRQLFKEKLKSATGDATD